MMEKTEKLHINIKTAWTLTVFVLFCFYMFWPVNFYLAESVKATYYMIVVPLLVGGVLYFRRLRDGLEYRFLVGFWLWFCLTRIINGNPTLKYDFQFVFDLALMLPFLAQGLSQTRDERRIFLDSLSAAVGGYHFAVGLIALSAFLRRTIIINPITEGSLGIIAEYDYARINIFDTHANVTGYWFLMALFLMIYEFFACRKKLWRIPILLSAAVDLIVIAITYSRSVRVSMALALALMTAVLLYTWLHKKSRLLCGVVVTVGMLAVAWAAFEGSALCADVMATLSYEISGTRPLAETVQQAELPEDDGLAEAGETAGSGRDPHAIVTTLSIRAGEMKASPMELSSKGLVHSDPRPKTGTLDELSSARLQIWRSAFQAIGVDPSILWKGQLVKDTMTVANTFSDPEATGGEPAHFHNSLIQVLMTTGIPGLLFAGGFLVLLVFHSLRLLFSSESSVSLETRMLALPVIASLPHFMLEAALFTTCDVRTLFFFLMCGMALGAERSIVKTEEKTE